MGDSQGLQNKKTSDEQTPYFQKLFDNPFILLVAGLLVMFVFYTIWGLYEILSLPESKLP